MLTRINQGFDISLEVYNTINYNECPEGDWESLDVNQIEDEFQTPFARLNGPRYTIMDSISSPDIITDCSLFFGGLDMSLVAILDVSLTDINPTTDLSYVITTVERNTVWYYYKGQKVYILESPSGDYFIMQSYSQMVGSNLQLNELEALGSRLTLPSGWSFKSTVLGNDYELGTQNGQTQVITDDLENTYQFMNGDCL